MPMPCKADCPRIFLLAIDALDWNLFRELADQGRLPVLQNLLARGFGGPIATLRPTYSPALWTSVVTGRRPIAHGITSFTEPALPPRGRLPVSGRSRRVKALWNLLSQSGHHSLVVNWWATHPAESIRGVMVSDLFRMARQPWGEPWPIPKEAVSPRQRADELAALRIHPHQIDQELVRFLLPRLDELDPRTPYTSIVAKHLAEDATALRILEHLLQTDPWQFATVYLTGLDNFGHSFSHFRSPALPEVPPELAENLGGLLDRAYELYDRWIGKILRAAGPDTNVFVISDHGFVHDHRRLVFPGNEECAPCAMHRPEAALFGAGPDLQPGAPVSGASLLDLTPTILTLCGLPVARDMEGRPLQQLLTNPARPIPRIASWEGLPGEDGMHPPGVHLDPRASASLFQRLASMGYVAAGGEEPAAIEAVQTLLARGWSYLDAGDLPRALPLLLEAFRRDPRRSDCLDPLLEALDLAQRPETAADILDQHLTARRHDADEVTRLLDELPELQETEEVGERMIHHLRRRGYLYRRDYAESLAPYFEAWIAYYRGDHQGALRAMQAFDHDAPGQPIVWLALARMGDPQAETLLQRIVQTEPDHADAWACLAEYQRPANPDLARRSALEAIRLRPTQPHAHALLAQLMPECCDAAWRAVRAGRTPAAWRQLAFAFRTNGLDRAASHATRLADSCELSLDAAIRNEAPLAGFRVEPRHTAAPPIPERPGQPQPDELIVVTGLPRSGTSALMQLLAAGGIPIVEDGQRPPDRHNPRGYQETASVLDLKNDPAWLQHHTGQAVKILFPQLLYLPGKLRSAILWIERDHAEVHLSQQRMVGGATNPDPAALEVIAQCSHELGRWLDASPHRWIRIRHHDLMTNPQAIARRIRTFLGLPLNPDIAARAIDPALHREQSSPRPEISSAAPETAE